MMIGIKKGEKVTVALSLSPFMYMGSNDLIEDNIPYFKADYDCYVFANSATHTFELLRYNKDIFSNISNINDITNELIPEMKNMFKFYNLNVGDEWDNNLFIIKRNKLYCISNYFDICEVIDFKAVKCPLIVNGALQDIKEVDEEERILEVARLIHRCTNHDLFPIMIFGGETRDIRIYHS